MAGVRSIVLLSCLSFAAAGSLKDWSDQGELMDEAHLSKPALSDDMISELNTQNGGTWVAGRNTLFEGATLKQAKVLMGTLQNTDASSFLPYKAPEKIVELPEAFDWRTDPRAAKCPSLNEIRDQANCGSCWAFGSVEAMTDRMCIASKGEQNVHLSAQDVASCDKLGDMGCNGGVPSTVYSYYHLSGIVDGGNYGDKSMCYSYQLKPCAHHSSSTKYANCSDEVPTPKCARECVDDGKSWEGSKHRGGAGYSVCQQGGNCAEAMQQDIYQNGPITGMFFVHQSFLAYKSGVYKAGNPLSDPMLGGHAIKIMGWGTENGAPYWLVANSWNEDWGDHGFFKIDRGHNQCQIENAMINGGPVAGAQKTAAEKSHSTPHYEDPKNGCQSDEVDISIQGVKGSVCVPSCSLFKPCPTDVPAGVTAKPQCVWQDAATKKKYCALICSPSANDDQCGTNASCKGIQGVGICTYDDANQTSSLQAGFKMDESIVV
jgi:cathepsin B|mmetsp:Transcript_20680/g.33402  ORF Transcript_20680/g.33402 Transcript_20680/m.33402 type:complete len:488 (-) Transcript_20680:125-1588(-)